MSNPTNDYEERMKIESTFWKTLGEEKETVKARSDEEAHKILDGAMETLDKAIKEAEEAKARSHRLRVLYGSVLATAIAVHLITQALILWRVW